MFNYLHKIWHLPSLRRKVLFTFFILVIFRLAAHISVPGINPAALENLFAQNQILGIFSTLTGGSMENFSIILMGLSPYINASIILQLMTVVIPKLEALSKEGPEGRRKINQYTRILTIPLAFAQSYAMILLLNSSSAGGGGALIADASNLSVILPIMIIITAGTVFLVWLGELITEKGIGNGISLIIFASIIAGMPAILGRMLTTAQLGNSNTFAYFIGFIVITALMLVFVVMVTEAQRNIPITYGSRGSATQDGNLPIKVNQAGMIPIIFAVSMMTFPYVLAQFFQASTSPSLQSVGEFLLRNFNASAPSYFYIIAYFLLIIAFSYFYVGIIFNPENVAENIQKRGGFIPGIRPGKQTSDFLSSVSSHLNLFGGLFLAVVAVIPILFTKYSTLTSADLIITGSGLIIVVGLILDLIRRIDSELVMHDYKKLY